MNNRNAAKIYDLLQENADLRLRIAGLQAQLRFLGQYKSLAAGIRGELLISNAVDGVLTVHTAPTDVLAPDGTRIEVKYAKKTSPDGGKDNTHLRWQWQKVFGETGMKKYDYLILIGEIDGRYNARYLDTESPFVMFCLSPSDVRSVMTKGTRGANGINLSCNPANQRSLASRLFRDCQITSSELTARFGLSAVSAVADDVLPAADEPSLSP